MIPVKGNQKKLHQGIIAHCQQTTAIWIYQQREKTRKRIINRRIEVFNPPDNLDPNWLGIKCVIKIFRYGLRGGQPYQSPQATYYLCSLVSTSSLIPKGIRQHWHVENRLHWVKDVVTQEDTSPSLLGKASTNISLLKSWVLT